jgi:hypothetical protein
MPTITQAEMDVQDAFATCALPVTAFYWHPRFGCYVIEHGDVLELVRL